ncbi:hypothetical protein GIS00_04400 [Nakamurella sp. YIM 132087]|uniref:Uncharacterized protein n=1 Tax=Nakamurella alba TaxID=2665158 RepID=A0A7K1FGE5_9ACTN|nr:hypothetical protein [Nakamurella alba]MTD13187.1 hypothetical protein [Nakamurella alba]
MGRHGAPEARSTRRVPWVLIGVVVLLVAAIGLGIWWWTLRSQTDPISADPVDGYAVVVSSPACPGGEGTVVDIAGTDPVVRATMDACGYPEGRRIAVQYLASDPAQVRLAGTGTAAGTPSAARWLPLAILLTGGLAVAATLQQLIERRRSRHSGRGTRVSMADLRARGESAAPPGSGAVLSAAAGTSAAGVAPGQGTAADVDPATGPPATSDAGWVPESAAPEAPTDGTEPPTGATEYTAPDVTEPAVDTEPATDPASAADTFPDGDVASTVPGGVREPADATTGPVGLPDSGGGAQADTGPIDLTAGGTTSSGWVPETGWVPESGPAWATDEQQESDGPAAPDHLSDLSDAGDLGLSDQEPAAADRADGDQDDDLFSHRGHEFPGH